MKILLLNPPSPSGIIADRRQRCTVKSPTRWIHPPIALAYLAAILKERNGARVKLIDAVIEDLDETRLLKQVTRFKPDLVVAVIGSFTFPSDFHCLSKLKEEVSCRTAGFGELPTAFYQNFLNEYSFLDYCFIGETELAAVQLVEYLEGKRSIDKVINIAYRGNQEIKINKSRMIENLDSLPFPDRSLLNNGSYHCLPFFSELFTDLTTSRGCPYRCKFCTTRRFWGPKYRIRSPKNILAEIRECINKFGIRNYFIPDDTYSADKSWVKKLNQGYRELGIKWALQTRVDLVDQQLLRDMAKAGCVYIHYGAESGSRRILDYYQKGISVPQIKNAFRWTREAGIQTCATFIIGSPAETRQSALKTIQLAKEIKSDYVQFTPLVPQPLSDFYYEFKQQGLLKHERFEEYTKPNIIFKSKNLTDKEILDLIKKAYRSTSFSPAGLTRRFWQVARSGDLKALQSMAGGAGWTIRQFLNKKKN